MEILSEHILYSFRRCPYAIRARWAILKCGIEVIIREIDLKQKPKELFEISSKGTVPVLKTAQGEIIEESMDIINWAIENSSPNQPFKNNFKTSSRKIKNIIDQNDMSFKYHLDRFKYSNRYSNINKAFHKEEALKIIYEWNSLISKSVEKGYKGWIMEDSESLADWAIWPFVRQYLIAEPSLFDKNNDLHSLKKWLAYYIDQKSYIIVMNKIKRWEKDSKPIFLK